jgi:hypothetical protein
VPVRVLLDVHVHIDRDQGVQIQFHDTLLVETSGLPDGRSGSLRKSIIRSAGSCGRRSSPVERHPSM